MTVENNVDLEKARKEREIALYGARFEIFFAEYVKRSKSANFGKVQQDLLKRCVLSELGVLSGEDVVTAESESTIFNNRISYVVRAVRQPLGLINPTYNKVVKQMVALDRVGLSNYSGLAESRISNTIDFTASGAGYYEQPKFNEK